MEIRLPSVYGLDELFPLLAALIIYLVFLFFLRLYFLPNFEEMKKKSVLKPALNSLKQVLQRLAVFGLLLLGFFWALEELGWADDFYDAIPNINIPNSPNIPNMPNLDLNGPSWQVTIPGVLIVLLLLMYFVIAPAFTRRRNRS